MPKFIVRDTMPCWVTWAYEIEAEDAALDLYFDGEHGDAADPEIGDGIDWLDGHTTVKPAPTTTDGGNDACP